jgi:hypothetical protein
MSQKVFSLTAGVFFLLIALGHLLRIVLGVSLVVQNIPIPMWASGIAAAVTAILAYEGLHFGGKAAPKM